MLPTLYQETSVVLALLKKQGGVFIRGNHCLNLVPGPDYVIIDTVLFAHSHIESWGQERADKYMSQTPGAGWFKRNIISRPLDYLRRLLTVRPNKRLLEAVAAYKKQFPELTHMVFGHSHPEHNVYFEHMGVKGVITKRGVNDLVLDI
jgi:hypothetical protein